MGRTHYLYNRAVKFNTNPRVKCKRGQFPLRKRNSHHRHRLDNHFADELTYISFNQKRFKNNYKDNILTGTVRDRYRLSDSLLVYDKSPEAELSQRAQLQNEMRKRKKEDVHDTTVGKNGLYTKDLMLMAWKMLKRRGNL
jgi:hypothetical protein